MNQTGKAIIITFFMTILGCQIFDDGTNEIVKEYYNSTQNQKVIVFEKMGNATTDNSIHLSIVESTYELNNFDGGNIFVSDIIEGAGSSIISVNWLNDDLVEIDYSSSVRVFKREGQIKNRLGIVSIKYKSGTK